LYVFPSVQICEERSRWDERWDDQQKVSYACSGDQFAGYDNVKSTRVKVRNMQRNKKLLYM
jgi:hypothetical protein